MSAATINVSDAGTHFLVSVAGEIDERGANELKQCFRSIPLERVRRVVVDFRKVTYIGSAGIGKLLVLYKDLAISGNNLELINVCAPIHHVLCEMKLDTIFSISKAES